MPPPGRKYKRPARTGPDTSTWTEEEKAAHHREQMLKTPVADMALTVRIINTLEENGVILAGDLLGQTYASLMRMKNFGDKTLREVSAAVAKLGLTPPAWTKPPKDDLPQPKKRGASLSRKLWGK